LADKGQQRMILLVAFILVPLAEIAIFIVVGQGIGLWPTLAAVVITALIGTALLRAQGFAVLRRLQHSLEHGALPVAEVFHGACLLVAGALLLTPGFLTDAIGFAMFVPGFRVVLGRALFARLSRSRRVRAGVRRRAGRAEDDAETVVDADFVDLTDDRGHLR
jgi:UPF0716 protein FxsA